MDLVIVESPTKARTLTRFLKDSYTVEASVGHIRDLPKSELGVDIDKQFEPRYVIPTDKRKRVSELKALAAKADRIILATDPDREGEAIAWHIENILKKALKKAHNSAQFDRIVFHEITKDAVLDALEHPRALNMKLVDAQQARRILDRLVGYKLSPLLWQKLSKRWLSAGRVQSVAVRLIVERERERRKFKEEEYWTLDAAFHPKSGQKDEITAALLSKGDEVYEKKETHDLFDGSYTVTKTSIPSKDAMDEIIKEFKKPFTVGSVEKRQAKRQPHPPYTTSTLQQDAGRRLHFSAKKTMQVAQKLYEEGFITYHRTDSVTLSEKFVAKAHAYIEKKYGKKYVVDKPRVFKTRSKVAQEAHEAIRPTDVNKSQAPDVLADSALNRDHGRLYELIWKRAVSTQASAAIFDSTTIIIVSENDYRFRTQGSVIVFDGFLAIAGRSSEDDIIPPVSQGETVTLEKTMPEAHQTKPPPRYSEASLVKTLEEKDIGRPSTYAPIISTVQDRQYVVREDKQLAPTELGEAVNDFLVKYFPDILELPFTAELEKQLDEIAHGKEKWEPVIEEFWKPFYKTLEKTQKEAEKVKIAEEEINEMCPECGSQLVIRMGRHGKFIACSAFPECKYTRQYAEKAGIECPECGGDIVVKKTRTKKTFYGCSNYPTCTFAAWKKEEIKKAGEK